MLATISFCVSVPSDSCSIWRVCATLIAVLALRLHRETQCRQNGSARSLHRFSYQRCVDRVSAPRSGRNPPKICVMSRMTLMTSWTAEMVKIVQVKCNSSQMEKKTHHFKGRFKRNTTQFFPFPYRILIKSYRR